MAIKKDLYIIIEYLWYGFLITTFKKYQIGDLQYDWWNLLDIVIVAVMIRLAVHCFKKGMTLLRG